MTFQKVKVNPRLLFFQTSLGSAPKCCIPSPSTNGTLVLQKKIFQVFTIYWHGGQLDHVIQMLLLWARHNEKEMKVKTASFKLLTIFIYIYTFATQDHLQSNTLIFFKR